MAAKPKRSPRPQPISLTKLHPAEQYAQDVISGKVVACHWVRQCVLRHQRDLVDGAKRGLYFDERAARHVIDFFKFLHHSKGEWAGQTFELSPWEQFLLWVIFGWKRSDGTRRFRDVYAEVSRKNGKSTLLAGVALYLLVADGEPGAEIYAAATKRDQARIVWSEAARMVKASPHLRRIILTYKNNLNVPGTNSKFEPLGADEDSTDGLNIHGVVIDELHAHKTPKLKEVLETATGARRQPLVFKITTAGYDRKSPCWFERMYATKVLDGVIVDDSYFAIIFTLDDGDDWTNPAVWIKANPNLGVSVKLDDIARKVGKAKNSPADENATKRLHFNIWTEQSRVWMPAAVWSACSFPVDATALLGRRCIIALDLAATTDMAGAAAVFPPTDEDRLWRVLMNYWAPEDGLMDRAHRDRAPYDAWARDGYITLTPGPVIDFDVIRAWVQDFASKYEVVEITKDPWNSTQLGTQLIDDGFTVSDHRQGTVSMNAPMRRVMELALEKEIAHGGHPVLALNMSNVVAKADPAGNLKPDKEKSSGRIDGAVCVIMGVGRAVVQPATSAPQISAW